MAYTIKILKTFPGISAVSYIEPSLRQALLETFVVHDWRSYEKKGVYIIELRKVRLREAKPYCGQHAGPCVRPQRRANPRMRYLESADWIYMHNTVNRILDACRAKAWVYTSRVDTFRVKGLINKFLVRHPDLGGRKRYQYMDLTHGRGMFPHYGFDPGTPSQFGPGDYAECDELLSSLPKFDEKTNSYVVDSAFAA